MTQTNLFDRKSQCDEILAWLKSGNALTPLAALELFGCMRLSGRILDLRKLGYPIKTETVHQNGKHFARYKLVA